MKTGNKTRAWNRTRAQLKKEFAEKGISRCEQCCNGNWLSFAHRMKRRKITEPEELKTVALLCIPCHHQIEVLPANEMFDEIDLIISGREHRHAMEEVWEYC